MNQEWTSGSKRKPQSRIVARLRSLADDLREWQETVNGLIVMSFFMALQAACACLVLLGVYGLVFG